MPAGLAPPPGPADQRAEEERSDGSPARAGLRGIGLPAVVAVAVGLLLVVVHLAAFPAAGPHDLPVGITGPAAVVDDVRAGVERARPGALALEVLPGAAAAAGGRSPPARSTPRSCSTARHGCSSPGRTGSR